MKQSTIIEYACGLAELEILQRYNLQPSEMMTDDGEGYKEEYQSEFDECYDTYLAELSQLAVASE